MDKNMQRRWARTQERKRRRADADIAQMMAEHEVAMLYASAVIEPFSAATMPKAIKKWGEP
jgi:hypothetical protein